LTLAVSYCIVAVSVPGAPTRDGTGGGVGGPGVRVEKKSEPDCVEAVALLACDCVEYSDVGARPTRLNV